MDVVVSVTDDAKQLSVPLVVLSVGAGMPVTLVVDVWAQPFVVLVTFSV